MHHTHQHSIDERTDYEPEQDDEVRPGFYADLGWMVLVFTVSGIVTGILTVRSGGELDVACITLTASLVSIAFMAWRDRQHRRRD